MTANPVNPPREPFDPDTTVVIANLTALAQRKTDAQLLEKVQHVVSVGLELPGIEVVAVTRRAGRGNTPGLVLAQFVCLDDKKQSWGPNKICETMLHTVIYIYVRPKVALTDCCVWIFRHFCSTLISHGNFGLLAMDAWCHRIAQRRTRTSSQRRAIAEAVGMEQHLRPVRGHSSPVGCAYCIRMWTAGQRTMLLLEAIQSIIFNRLTLFQLMRPI